jgi:hypothetical protein
MRQTVTIASERLGESLRDHLVDGSRDRRFAVLATLTSNLCAGTTHLTQLIQQATS